MKKIYLYSFLAIVLLSFILIAFGSTEDENSSSSTPSSTSSSSSSSSIISKSPYDYITSGAPLSTLYFDVTVNKVSIKDRVSTGNQFADLKKEEDIEFLVLNTTFKNTSNESRMIMDGEILINYNGKIYKFDKSETIMLDGWGLMLDQINPLTTKTTNLVYKIPVEINGNAFYRPGRSGRDDLIYLGPIK
jgi:hypothetical protein